MNTEFKMKETSFNLIDFFNFQSVGEYNKDTQFHPIEQAMIIWKSHVVSIEKKMQALNELLELYTEEEFQYGYNGKDTYGVRAFSYKQLLKHTVDGCQAAMSRRNQKVDGLIYKEKFYENNYYDMSKSYYFTDFQSAEKDLLEEMASYKQDFPGTLFGGEIRSISLTERELGRQEKDTYIYNSKGELAEVFFDTYEDEQKEEYDVFEYYLDSICVWIPLPLEKGDIIRHKSPWTEKISYGVCAYTTDLYDEVHLRLLTIKDNSDEFITVDSLYCNEYSNDVSIGPMECGIFNIEKCPEDEVPEEESVLLLLQSVYRGEMLPGDFIWHMHTDGKKAYTKLNPRHYEKKDK